MSVSRAARVCGALLLSTLLATAPSGSSAAGAGEEQPPISVTADKMEYFTEESRVVFTGNALAVQEDVTLSADSMKVVLAEGSAADTGAVEKISAKGNVTFRQLIPETGDERFATGKKAVYEAAEGVVTLTGSPRMWEGKNVIVGEVMKFFIQEHRFVVEGRVGLTIFPEKDAEEEEKQ
jgi:lipopolysaccharide export system protein LptA